MNMPDVMKRLRQAVHYITRSAIFIRRQPLRKSRSKTRTSFTPAKRKQEDSPCTAITKLAAQQNSKGHVNGRC